MEVINLTAQNSLLSRYMMELRNVDIQGDRMRFRHNIQRIGQIMAYEISRRMAYKAVEVTTPLAKCVCQVPAEAPVLATIFRAGLPLHEGFLSYFDDADNAFVSAYRRYLEKGSDEFEVCIEYLASPSIEGRVLILCDPMLATGASMELSYRALLTKGEPSHIHVASVIASEQAVEYVKQHFPEEKTTVWVAAIDGEINAHKYIVPGLGDAGDLAYGQK